MRITRLHFKRLAWALDMEPWADHDNIYSPTMNFYNTIEWGSRSKKSEYFTEAFMPKRMERMDGLNIFNVSQDLSCNNIDWRYYLHALTIRMFSGGRRCPGLVGKKNLRDCHFFSTTIFFFFFYIFVGLKKK